MSESAPRVLVIGAGAAGALCVAQLCRIGAPLCITVVGKGGCRWRGAAFTTDNDYHLLNIPSCGMSASPENPNDFVEWLQRGVAAGDVDAKWLHPDHQHAPRRLFGRYLEHTVTEAISNAPHTTVQLCDTEVVDIVDGGDGTRRAECASADFGPIPFDMAVLCIGNLTPQLLPCLAPLAGSPRFVANPWSFPLLPADARIALVGTRLTAVDFVLHLANKCAFVPGAGSGEGGQQRGRLFMVSRTGKLPRENMGEFLSPQIEPTYVSSFVERSEGGVDVDAVARSICAAIQEHEANGGSFHSVIDSMRPHTNTLWQRMDGAQRRRFLSTWRDEFEIRRHRVAPGQLRTICELQARGACDFVNGNIEGAVVRDNTLELRVRGSDGAEIVVEADYVVNCTGPDLDYRNTDDRLLANLRRKQWIRPESNGAALEVNPVTGACLLAGTEGASENPWLFAVGPPRKGTQWESIAVKDIRQQAKDFANHVASMSAFA